MNEHLASGLRKVLRALPPSRQREAAVMVLLLVIGAFAEALTLGAVFPFLLVLTDPERASALPVLGDFIRAIPPGTNVVAATTLSFVGLLVLSGVLRLYLAWRSLALVQDMAYDLALKAFRKVIRQPYAYYLSQNSSRAIAGFDMIYGIGFTVLQSGMQALSSAIVALVLIVAMVLIDAVIAGILAVVMIGTYLATSLAVRATLDRNSVTWSAAWNQRVKRIQEAVGGIRNILLDRLQPAVEEPFERAMADMRRTGTANAFISYFPRIVLEIVALAMVAILVWFLASSPQGLVAMIPTLGAVAACGQRIMPMLQATYYGWSQIRGSEESIQEALRLLELPEEKLPVGRGEAVTVPTESLELDAVSFAFVPGRPVLHDITLAIRKGDRIGIVGPTGAGKSTLMGLLLGLLAPTSGQIRINGEVLDQTGIMAWQRGVAHVPQSIFLADDTLAANIAFGTPVAEVDMDRVRLSARNAGIDGFIASLPEGYETHCGERGIRLSGGQRQRIGIARALYKQASFLVLDEATSALDTETEREVIAAIGGLASDITVVMVAHRLSTLADCDRIVHLASGRIVRVENRTDSAA